MMWMEMEERRSTSSTPTMPSQVTTDSLTSLTSINTNKNIEYRPMPFFQGRATYADKLFKVRSGRFEDLLSDDANIQRGVANHMAGRSVACVDRKVLHLLLLNIL